MKKYFIAIALSLICFITCLGQARINRAKIAFNNSGPTLNKVIGWAYDKSVGEWVDCVNLLEGDKRYKKYATSASWMSHNYNNIIGLQFKTLTCNNVQYYVLVWEKWDGSYKYPNIREDWEYWETKMFMMFTEEEMEKLRNITNDPITIEVPTPSRRRYDSESSDEDVIQTAMNSDYPYKTSIIIYKATDGSIRFMFQEYVSSYGDKIDDQYFEISEVDYFNLLNVGF